MDRKIAKFQFVLYYHLWNVKMSSRQKDCQILIERSKKFEQKNKNNKKRSHKTNFIPSE